MLDVNLFYAATNLFDQTKYITQKFVLANKSFFRINNMGLRFRCSKKAIFSAIFESIAIANIAMLLATGLSRTLQLYVSGNHELYRSLFFYFIFLRLKIKMHCTANQTYIHTFVFRKCV